MKIDEKIQIEKLPFLTIKKSQKKLNNPLCMSTFLPFMRFSALYRILLIIKGMTIRLPLHYPCYLGE